jgi:hypothetical protein
MNINIPMVDVAVTADSTAAGAVTIASTTPFYIGAVCQLYKGDGSASVQVQVVKISSATVLMVRLFADQTGGRSLPPNYGFSDVSAFTLAATSRICQNAQSVRVEPDNVQQAALLP